jgi:hypothetical protein
MRELYSTGIDPYSRPLSTAIVEAERLTRNGGEVILHMHGEGEDCANYVHWYYKKYGAKSAWGLPEEWKRE